MNKKKILIVDDTPVNIKVIMTLLDEKYDYFVALTGEKALSILEEVTPDLILLDVIMPEMDGFSLCRKIKDIPGLNDIPLIFLTSLDEKQDERTGRDLGAVDFLYKPFDPAHLKKTIANLFSEPGNP